MLGLEPACKVVVLFSGSRRSEVGRLLTVLLQTAKQLAANDAVQFVLSQAQSLDDDLFAAATDSGLPLMRVRGQSARVAEACDAVIAASGTLTLELALLEVPMVIVYRAAPLTWAIFSRLVKIPHVSLANILLEHGAAPELLQHHANPDEILEALQPLLTAAGAAAQQR